MGVNLKQRGIGIMSEHILINDVATRQPFNELFLVKKDPEARD